METLRRSARGRSFVYSEERVSDQRTLKQNQFPGGARERLAAPIERHTVPLPLPSTSRSLFLRFARVPVHESQVSYPGACSKTANCDSHTPPAFVRIKFLSMCSARKRREWKIGKRATGA